MRSEADSLKLYTSVKPSEKQKMVQDMKFYAFLHYGMNTFTNREWGDGTESESLFNPQKQDTDQWCRVLADAGMKGVILTAKHHDGFCLWQTDTTEHSVKNSPYKDGKGDVVGELAASCRKYGLKMGVYLSPWDRNAECYGTAEYNDFYIRQLTELLTRYGDMFVLWMDGACGAAADGKPMQKYDFDRILKTAYTLQPGICTAIMGNDIRWVGNESGSSRESEWNVVPKALKDPDKTAEDSQKEDDGNFVNEKLDEVSRDLGSRKILAGYDEFCWFPAEMDVSIRRGWFYHKSQNRSGIKSVTTLLDIYERSVGGNTTLLLNIPPDTDGLIHSADEKRLHAMGEFLRKEAARVVPEAVLSEFTETERGNEYTFSFPKQKINRLDMEENTDFSQRIECFSVYAVTSRGEKKLYSGTTVGFGKIMRFKPTETKELRIVIEKCRLEPHLKYAKVYSVDSL